MADLTKTIEIIFGAVDATGGAMQSVGKGIEDFSTAAKDALAPLNDLADTIKTVDTVIVALGLAFGGVAIQKAGEFGQQVAEIGTLFAASNEQLGSLRSGVLDYATDSTQSIESINRAIYSAVSAGVDWADSIDFVTQAEKLAVAGKADLEAVTNVLTGTMNAYGAGVNEASKYSDTLFKTVQLGQTTLPALATSLSQVTSTAAAAGVGFEEVAAAVVGLTTAGVPTEQAMTALKAAISNIVSPSKEASDEAERLGINFSANALEAKGLSGVFQEVYEKTDGNIEVMARLFGSMEALKAATALGADNSKLYAKALEAIPQAAGATEAAYVSMAEQFDNANQRMKNSLDAFLITVGSQLTDEFGGLVVGLGDVFKSLKVSLDAGAFDSVFAVIEDIAGRMAAMFRGIAAALPEALARVDFSSFASAIQNLSTSVGSIFEGFDLSSSEGIAKVIQLIVDTVANLLNVGAGIANVWADAVQAATPLVEKFAQMSQSAATASGEVLGFADVLTVLFTGLGSVGKGLEAVGNGIELLAGVQLGKLAVGLAGSSAAMSALKTAAFGVGTAIGLTAQAGLVGAAGAAGYAVGGVLADGIDYVVEKLTGSSSLGVLIYDLVNGTDELADGAVNAADGVKQIGDASGAATGAVSGAATAVEKVGEASTEAGRAIDEGLIQSMIEMATRAGDAKTKAEFLAAAAAALKNPTIEARLAMSDAARAFKDSATRAGEASEAAAIIREEYEKLRGGTKAATDELKTSSDVMELLGKKTDLTNKELITLAESTRKAEIELEKIASNERIKNIEANVKLNVAQIEAETERIKAAFESINTTIDSTGGLLGDLFNILANSNLDWSALRAIEDQISMENRRREEALELQKKLTEAQIKEIEARTAAMLKGEGIIKIDGAGLQPHLEAMMWEVLKALQVRTNAEGLAMLLGT